MQKIEKKVLPLVDIEKIDDDFITNELSLTEIAENLATFDDEILDKCLENPESITKEMIDKKLELLIKKAEIFPVI